MISHHIKQFLDDGELADSTVRRFLIVRDDGEIDDSVIRKFRITAADGKAYETNHYALDVAIYVGYRVNSRQGALFRRWATDILVRFAKYGYAMDIERLKAPEQPGILDELKEIRDIGRNDRYERNSRSSWRMGA